MKRGKLAKGEPGWTTELGREGNRCLHRQGPLECWRKPGHLGSHYDSQTDQWFDHDHVMPAGGTA